LGRKSGINLSRMPILAQTVASAANRPIPAAKPIVGDSVFTHESGIHVHALLKDPETYEAMDPARFGRSRRFVLGKHSGTASVVNALETMGLATDDRRTRLVLDQVRARASRTKHWVGTQDLREFHSIASAHCKQ
jgi:homocitrate synthase NifV